MCVAIFFTTYDFCADQGICLVQAAKKDELKQQNEEDQGRLEDIDDQVNELEEEQEGIDAEIQILSDEIAELMASISLLEEEIEAKKAQIEQAKVDLAKAQEVEKQQYEAMKVRVKAMYESGETTMLDILFSASSMQDMLNKADYIEKMHEYDKKLFNNYKIARQNVEDLKENLEIEESELEAAQEGLREEMDTVEEARAELEAISEDYAVQERKRREEEAKKNSQNNNNNDNNSNDSADSNNNSSTPTQKPTAAVDTSSIMAANGSAKGKEIAAFACGFVGNPYVAGGTSLTNGADCSGFTQSVFKQYGYSLPRNSTSQRSVGREVSYAEAEPGDIICYPGHVAIYIGNGKIVHASSAKTGIKISNALYRSILCVRRVV